MHVGTVRVDGAKMAKSTGNLVLVSDVLADCSAPALRLLLLDRPWAQPWDYDDAAPAAATARLERLYSAAARGVGEDAPSTSTEAVTAALLADLDVPKALDVAEEAGGPAARLLLSVLNLT
jgi:cysteinyl-tRNA synthetase